MHFFRIQIYSILLFYAFQMKKNVDCVGKINVTMLSALFNIVSFYSQYVDKKMLISSKKMLISSKKITFE